MFKFLKRRKFQKHFDMAVRDGVLTSRESRELTELAGDLKVNQGEVDKIRRDHFNRVTAPMIAEFTATRRLSPAQEAELATVANRLGINLELDDTIEMCRELWAWENGEQVYLAEAASPILLKSGETCCFTAPAVWKQMKIVKTRIGSRGFSTSFRIMKGVSYRVSNLKPVYSEAEGLAVVDVGSLSLSNKRLTFAGNQRSTSINHGRILDVQLYQDGIEVSKSSGKHDFFLMSPIAAEYAVMALNVMSRG